MHMILMSGDNEPPSGSGNSLAMPCHVAFSNVWANKKLKLAHTHSLRMVMYSCCVLPHFLSGAEAWNCTPTQMHKLETALAACLRA